MRESRDDIEGASGNGSPSAHGAGAQGRPVTDETELPEDVLEEAERLARLGREAIDENEREAARAERNRLLDEHGFTTRIRETDATLVCHPAEWVEDGTVRTDRIEDVTRAVEIPLEGPGDPDDWAEVDARNRELVASVRDDHGEVHGSNAAALADFMGNHYAKPITSATPDEIDAFLDEYFVRNAWPSADQRAVVERSVELLFEAAGEPVPPFSSAESVEE